jgi:hypothetical protein
MGSLPIRHPIALIGKWYTTVLVLNVFELIA